MKQFMQLYNKVGGNELLKQYAGAHVLGFAVSQILAQGFSKKSLEIVRLAVDNKIHKKLQKKNAKFIKNYVAKNNKRKYVSEAKNDKIWFMWLQGLEEAPDIVKKCYSSLKENIKDREIVVITGDNFSDYVKMPEYILDKYNKGIITRTHFSDLIRVELLAKYGGTWIDSTVFCSGMSEQDRFYLDSDLFFFQTLKPGLDGHCTSLSSWFITAKAGNPVIMLTRALLYNYWKNNDKMINYFLFHHFFQFALDAYPDENMKVIPVSNETPHVLLLRLFEAYDDNIWKAVKNSVPFHKLSYKFDSSLFEKKGTYYSTILK